MTVHVDASASTRSSVRVLQLLMELRHDALFEFMLKFVLADPDKYVFIAMVEQGFPHLHEYITRFPRQRHELAQMIIAAAHCGNFSALQQLLPRVPVEFLNLNHLFVAAIKTGHRVMFDYLISSFGDSPLWRVGDRWMAYGADAEAGTDWMVAHMPPVETCELLQLVSNRYLKALERLVPFMRHDPLLLSAREQNELVSEAAAGGFFPALLPLLHAGIISSGSVTSLHIWPALRSGHADTAKLLLQYNPHVHLSYKYVVAAAQTGDEKVTHLVLDHYAVEHAQEAAGLRAQLQSGGMPGLIQHIVRQQQQGSQWCNAFAWAAERGEIALIPSLIQALLPCLLYTSPSPRD